MVKRVRPIKKAKLIKPLRFMNIKKKEHWFDQSDWSWVWENKNKKNKKLISAKSKWPYENKCEWTKWAVWWWWRWIEVNRANDVIEVPNGKDKGRWKWMMVTENEWKSRPENRNWRQRRWTMNRVNRRKVDQSENYGKRWRARPRKNRARANRNAERKCSNEEQSKVRWSAKWVWTKRSGSDVEKEANVNRRHNQRRPEEDRHLNDNSSEWKGEQVKKILRARIHIERRKPINCNWKKLHFDWNRVPPLKDVPIFNDINFFSCFQAYTFCGLKGKRSFESSAEYDQCKMYQNFGESWIKIRVIRRKRSRNLKCAIFFCCKFVFERLDRTFNQFEVNLSSNWLYKVELLR